MEKFNNATMFWVGGITSITNEKYFKEVATMIINKKDKDIRAIFINHDGNIEDTRLSMNVIQYENINVGDILIYDGVNLYKFVDNLLKSISPANENICLLSISKEEILKANLKILEELVKNKSLSLR